MQTGRYLHEAFSHFSDRGRQLATVGVVLGVALTAAACNGGHENIQYNNDQANLLSGQFAYMPGATQVDGGKALSISGLDRRIVEQDGSDGQPNPPVNEYGTYLSKVAGDFTVRATMQNVEGATLQLYSEPPTVMDEFRVEPSSLRFTLQNNTLQVKRWDGRGTNDLAHQYATETQDFTIADNDNVQLALTRQDNKLDITANGKDVGSIDAGNVFDKGTVWFGADAGDKPWKLSELTAEGVNGGAVEVGDVSKLALPNKSENALQELASKTRPGFLIGTAVSLAPYAKDQQYRNLLQNGNFGQITIENSLKWQNVEPQKPTDGSDNMSFQEGDALVDIAKRNGMKINGHAIGAFGEELPQWLTSLPYETDAQKEYIGQLLDDHITKAVSHYKGQVQSWDVVNEPFADYDTFDPDNGAIYRQNFWYKALGKDYIARAFKDAHAADPDAELWMNDFGLEMDDDRWNLALNLAKDLKAQGVPITGIGLQAHVYDIHGDKISASKLDARFKQAAEAGIKVKISEQDVDDGDGQTVQAQQFAAGLKPCIDNTNCVSYTMWGFDDAYDLYQEKNDAGQWQLQSGNDLIYKVSGGELKETPAVAALRDVLNQ